MKTNKLSRLERLELVRNKNRPKARQVLDYMINESEEVSGDRLYGDDKALICSFTSIGSQKCVVIAQDKGFDTASRLEANFGMMHPEGFRKALRVMKLAEKFNLPVITLIDTPGAYPGLSAEKRGQGWAIANNLLEMSRLKTPILSIILSEGCSGGALGICVADKVAILENAYFSVISPEGCASILFKDSLLIEKGLNSLKIQSEDQLLAEIVDDVILEPEVDKQNSELICQNIKCYIEKTLRELLCYPSEKLVDMRMNKYRDMGVYEFTEA